MTLKYHIVKCTTQIITSQHSSITWLVWLSSWMFIYKISGCGLESRCCHLNFNYSAVLEQGVSGHSENSRVYIPPETRKWYDNNIQPNAPYRYVLTTQLNHLGIVTKWLSAGLRTKWVWVHILLLPLKLQILRLLQIRSHLEFRKILECRFTLKRVRDMIITSSQIHRKDKYSQCSPIIWLVCSFHVTLWSFLISLKKYAMPGRE